MEKTFIALSIVLFILLACAVLAILYFVKIVKQQGFELEEKDKQISEKETEISGFFNFKRKVATDRDKIQEELDKLCSENERLSTEIIGFRIRIEILESTETKLRDEIITLNKQVQEKEDYAHWVGTTALETTKEYNLLVAEKERLEKKICELETELKFYRPDQK